MENFEFHVKAVRSNDKWTVLPLDIKGSLETAMEIFNIAVETAQPGTELRLVQVIKTVTKE